MQLTLTQRARVSETVILAALTLACFVISLFRTRVSDTLHYLFLNWNLFLAFVPWAVVTAVRVLPGLERRGWVLVPVTAVWLLFFPNAPYILTDLFHLKYTDSMPLWFDLVLILLFAWTGLLFGFLSLWDLEILLSRPLGKRLAGLCSVAFLFIGSFGIYVGRYLRWNSWDILTEPMALLYDLGDRLINPFQHPRTWGVTLFMGFFLNAVYWSLRWLRTRRTD
ncbi:MAG TPA: DUF1361 domain-containing protein [Cytophagales bacterium]|nr:DUF1361 domain-containing protein [Cytophagales bacterium]HAA17280.1 DUF1361 domain-containing protein [Cytophagales bacterium]HAP58648.1 DUF1361 domain-containing protein [Cytophagales bacterium]